MQLIQSTLYLVSYRFFAYTWKYLVLWLSFGHKRAGFTNFIVSLILFISNLPCNEVFLLENVPHIFPMSKTLAIKGILVSRTSRLLHYLSFLINESDTSACIGIMLLES